MRRLTRKKKIALFTSLVFGGCIVTAVFLVVGRYDYPLAAREYDKGLADYRKAGFYYKNGSFYEESMPYPGSGATMDLNNAAATLSGQGEIWIANTQRRIDNLRKNKDYAGLLKELEGGAKKPLKHLVLATRHELSNGLQYPREQAILADWLTARAEAKAGLGDVEGALQDLRTGWKLAAFALEDTVTSEVPKVVVQGALKCAVVLQNDPKAMQAITDLFAHLPKTDLMRILRMGAGFLAEMISKADMKLIETSSPFSTAPPGPKTFWQDADEKIVDRIPTDMRRRAYLARLFQMLVEMDGIIKDNVYDMVTMEEKWLQMNKRLADKSAKSWAVLQSFSSGVASAPMMEPYIVPQVQQKVLAAAFQALLHKQKTGNFPTQIQAIDPYSRKPLNLQPIPGGIRIYSVGKNKRDDNGLGDDITADLIP